MLEMTLLIADDEEELIENITYDLKKSVSNIIVAENGAQALKLLKENQVDVVLTDINMPQKNGLEFTKQAREWGYDLPVIFLTAHGDDNLMKQALAMKAFDFIDKPYKKDALIEVLTEAWDESQKMQKIIVDDHELDSDFKKSYFSMIEKNKAV